MKKDNLPQTHIELTRRTWGRIRKGLLRCMKNAEDCQTCIEWCRMFPEHTHRWTEMLQGAHNDKLRQAIETEDYFDLNPDAMAWWEQMIQNHPFAAIFAKERYSSLLEKRKKSRRTEPCA